MRYLSKKRNEDGFKRFEMQRRKRIERSFLKNNSKISRSGHKSQYGRSEVSFSSLKNW